MNTPDPLICKACAKSGNSPQALVAIRATADSVTYRCPNCERVLVVKKGS